MLGIARSEARISTGWCVGPLRPMPIAWVYAEAARTAKAPWRSSKA